MSKLDKQDKRFLKILGCRDWDEAAELECEEAMERFLNHLAEQLELPCEVTGTEDFSWEEFYVFGPGDPEEYATLRKKRPSYQDTYDLLSVADDQYSEWMLFSDDLAAIVRRKSDKKKFVLGLSELKVVDKKSKNHELLDDYAVWFVNNR